MEGGIPIDIHYNKLLDWLINRRHCQQQWQGAALEIREKINNAIQDMPPVEEITQLLQGTYINYFHCLRILELLKDTESGSKNIFGRYSSQRMKDWQEVGKLYEKNGLYLAEAAQLLMRNVNYEIPSLKRQLNRCQQAQKDCTRKEGEYCSSASELRERFTSSCKMMGIEGKKPKVELLALVKDMPVTFDLIGRQASGLRPSIDYYTGFLEFTLQRKDLTSECIPLLRFISTHGNTTTYEYRTGKAPTSIVEPTLNLSMDDTDIVENAAEIDWGDSGSESIDFGISAEDSGDGIDYGEVDAGGDIDWGKEIETMPDDMGVVVIEPESSLKDTDDGVARGNDALTILDNPTLRSMFLDELMEVEAFLFQRLSEMQAAPDVIVSSQLQAAPQQLDMSEDDIQTKLKDVRDILSQFTTKRMKDLLHIRSSPRHVERLAGSLSKNLDDAEKMMARSRLMATRRSEALEEEKGLEPTLDLIKKRTIELKQQIEGEISKKYKDRRVNIMGEINTI